MDRQYKREHRIIWTDIEGNNGLGKVPRTMEVIHSYPSPRNGWQQELLTMMNLDKGDCAGAETQRGLGVRSHKNLKWGRPMHWFRLPIFREVVLSDACESTNRVKKWSYQGILF